MTAIASEIVLPTEGVTGIASDGEDPKISPTSLGPASPTLVISDSLDDLAQCIDSQRHGVWIQRPHLCDGFQVQADVDEAANAERFGTGGDGIKKNIMNEGADSLSASLETAADEILARAALPANLSEIIRCDICSIGLIVGRACSFAGRLQVKLEIMGESVCSRWHRDQYVGRAIVTYNSNATEYTDDSNVDFWELENCGNNACVIKDTSEIHNVEVGDVLFMKGKEFPDSSGLVHKSPEKRYHEDGRVVNRLILKIDVPEQCLKIDVPEQ